MNDKMYNFGHDDHMSDVNPDVKTSQNLEAIERLFEEWDDDRTTSDDMGYVTSDSSVSEPYSNSSFYEELLHDKKRYDTGLKDSTNSNQTNYSAESNDELDKTREIDSVDLAELKAIQAELHRIYDEDTKPDLESNSPSQSKGKSLTKATKQGIAFSNGSLTRTFLDCVVLCFVTASMGFVFLMNIINHI